MSGVQEYYQNWLSVGRALRSVFLVFATAATDIAEDLHISVGASNFSVPATSREKLLVVNKHKKCFRSTTTSLKGAPCNGSNTDLSMWKTNPWEVAKFLIKAGGYRHTRSAVDADLSAFVAFLQCVSVVRARAGKVLPESPLCKSVVDARNKWAHCGQQSFSDDERATLIRAIICGVRELQVVCVHDNRKLDADAASIVADLQNYATNAPLQPSLHVIDARQVARAVSDAMDAVRQLCADTDDVATLRETVDAHRASVETHFAQLGDHGTDLRDSFAVLKRTLGERMRAVEATQSQQSQQLEEHMVQLEENMERIVALEEEALDFTITDFIVPPLPLHYVAPQSIIAHVNERLLDNVIVTGIVGMGGIGKTALATAVAQDAAIKSHFGDRILWIRVGQRVRDVELSRIMRRTVKLLAPTAKAGPDAPQDDLQWAYSWVQRHLGDDPILLVLDNVWEEHVVSLFRRCVASGPSARILVTTRNIEIVLAEAVQMPLPSEQDALRMLLRGAEWPNEHATPSGAIALVSKVGALPLAIAMLAPLLKKNTASIDLLVERLDRAKTAWGAQLKGDHNMEYNVNLFSTVQLSLDTIDDECKETIKRCYLDMAVFKKGQQVPTSVCDMLWDEASVDVPFAYDSVLDVLVKRSLARCDERSNTITLHDLQHDFTEFNCKDMSTRHYELVCRYRSKSGGWSLFEDDGYYYENIVRHLLLSGSLANDAFELVTDFRWLQRLHSLHLLTQGVHQCEQVLPSVDGDQRAFLTDLKKALKLASGLLHGRGSDDARWLAFQLLACMDATYEHLSQRLRSTILAVLQACSCGMWLEPVGSFLNEPLVNLIMFDSTICCGALMPVSGNVLSGHVDGTARISDVTTGVEVRQFKSKAVGKRLFKVLPLLNGTRLLAANLDKAWVWGSACEVLWEYSEQGKCMPCVAACDDRFAVGISDEIRLIDAESFNELTRILQTGTYLACALTANAQHLVVSCGDNVVRWWHVGSGNLLGQYNTQVSRAVTDLGKQIQQVCILPNEQGAVFGSFDGYITVIRLAHDNIRFQASKCPITCLTLTNDSESCLSSSSDHAIRCFSLASGDLLFCLAGHTNMVRSLEITHDGHHLVSFSQDASVRVWDLKNRSGCDLVDTEERIYEMYASRNGAVALLRGGGGKQLDVWRWECNGGETQRSSVIWGSSCLLTCCCAIAGQSARVVVCQPALTSLSFSQGINVQQSDISLWDLESEQRLARMVPESAIMSVAISEDGRRIVAGDYSGSVFLFDSALSIVQVCGMEHTGPVSLLAMSPDGLTIVSAEREGLLIVWELSHSVRVKQRVPLEHCVIHHLQISCAGSHFVVHYENAERKSFVSTFSTEPHCCIYKVELELAPRSLCIMNDGRVLFVLKYGLHEGHLFTTCGRAVDPVAFFTESILLVSSVDEGVLAVTMAKECVLLKYSVLPTL